MKIIKQKYSNLFISSQWDILDFLTNYKSFKKYNSVSYLKIVKILFSKHTYNKLIFNLKKFYITEELVFYFYINLKKKSE